MISFNLHHVIDFKPGAMNWLSYSHGDAPTDRQVISDHKDTARPQIRMARHYFLTDHAIGLLPGGYNLIPCPGQMWNLEIHDASDAAMFKLVFM